MVKLLVGGLGGGGDVIASLATAFYLESLGFETVMTGVHRWSMEAVTGGVKLSEALIQVDSSLRSSKRIPEIAVAETLNRKTYLVLMGSRVDKAENAFKTLFESENIEGAVLVDAGGDSLVRGDEAQLGSPFTDHPAAAALVRASRSAGVKAVVGVAALGADYEIPFSLLLENFQSLVARGAYMGCYKPTGNVREAFLREAGRVLKRVPSFMSTIYYLAVKGEFGPRYFSILYFKGTFNIERHHAYTFYFDAEKLCTHSLICTMALHNNDVKEIRRTIKKRRRLMPTRREANIDKTALNQYLQKQVNFKAL